MPSTSCLPLAVLGGLPGLAHPSPSSSPGEEQKTLQEAARTPWFYQNLFQSLPGPVLETGEDSCRLTLSGLSTLLPSLSGGARLDVTLLGLLHFLVCQSQQKPNLEINLIQSN